MAESSVPTQVGPRTMAGKALLAAPTLNVGKAIVRIEQEAAALERRRIKTELRKAGAVNIEADRITLKVLYAILEEGPR